MINIPWHAIITAAMLLLLLFCPAARAANIDPDNSGTRNAWGENIGWINLKPSLSSGITVSDNVLTGFAWGENIGWINLSPANGFDGVFNNGTGVLSGYAWGENVGWINFDGVSIDACGYFQGNAWGENIGWISFRSDGPAPFKVNTSWIPPDSFPPSTSISGLIPGWFTSPADIVLNAADNACGVGVQEVRHKLDNGQEIITAGSSAIIRLGTDGEHSLTYFSVDSNGNAEGETTVPVRVDTTPPLIAVATPENNATFYINNPVTTAYTVTDATSGVGTVTATAQNGTPLNTGSAGSHIFAATAADQAGNTSSISYAYSVLYPGNIDTGGNQAQYAWGENIGWINFKPSWGPGITVSDTFVTGKAWGENIGWINLNPDNGGVVNDTFGRLSGNAWGENVGWINFKPTGGGVYVDSCGDFNGVAWGENIGWINFRSDGPVPFKVNTSWIPPDTFPPSTSVNGVTSGWSATPAVVTFDATDNACGVGVKEVHYKVDNGQDVKTTGANASTTVTNDGNHTLTYFAVDNNGVIEDEKTVSVKVDSTPPIISVATPSDNSTFYINSPVTAAFTVTDATSGVGAITASAQNGTPVNTGSAGGHSFTVTAADQAGNMATFTRAYTIIFSGNIDPGDTGCQYAWGENVGWINFKPSWGPGITVSDSSVSGRAWGENIGWITMNPVFGGVMNDGAGKLSGTAWSENVGWINFNPAGGGVTIGADGTLSGKAWGENIGWVNFSGANSCVKTAWIPPPNRPPVASGQTVTLAEDSSIGIILAATDPDGDNLSYAVLTQPQHGTLSGSPPSMTYTPNADYNGTDSFTFKADDGQLGSNIATVAITVNPVNDQPVATNQTVTTAEDTQVVMTLGATDVDRDFLSYAIVSGPSHGTLSGTAPNVTYTPAANYNGTDSFTFKANDGQIDSNVATATIMVSAVNDVPVIIGAANATIVEGATFTGTGSFADPDADTWNVTVDYGENTGTFPLQFGPDKTFRLTHTYADNGSYTVSVAVIDSAGTSGIATTAVTVLNAIPAVQIEAPATVAEGRSLSVKGTFTDAGILDTHTATWNWGDGTTSSAGAIIESNGSGTVTGTHNYADNGSYTITLTVTDKDGGAVSTTAVAVVTNLPPVPGAISAPFDPVPVNTSLNVSVAFSDVGIKDAHSAIWNWGDNTTSPGSVSESNGSGAATGIHTYATPGVYTVSVSITDKDGGTGTAIFEYVVVYDPSGGFVTGGGWIMSPAGAYITSPAMTGKANFGFVSKYLKGANVPTGETQFVFKSVNLDFQSTSYEWLVVAGAKAQFKGVGTINNSGSYGFLLTAIDGALISGGGLDKFRIKIWDKDTDQIIYDNLIGAADTADPSTAIGGGSIVIHK